MRQKVPLKQQPERHFQRLAQPSTYSGVGRATGDVPAEEEEGLAGRTPGSGDSGVMWTLGLTWRVYPPGFVRI